MTKFRPLTPISRIQNDRGNAVAWVMHSGAHRLTAVAQPAENAGDHARALSLRMTGVDDGERGGLKYMQKFVYWYENEGKRCKKPPSG